MKSQFYQYRIDKKNLFGKREKQRKIREIGADKYWISYLLLHSKSSLHLVV